MQDEQYYKRLFMAEAVRLARENIIGSRNGPFGAVVVQNRKIIARGRNGVVGRNDPTAHAEIEAIRTASQKLRTHDLSGCELYSSCEPCPMCLAAAYWAKIDSIYYASSQRSAAKAGFKNRYIYREIIRSPRRRDIPTEQVEIYSFNPQQVFEEWQQKPNKVIY